MYWVPRRRGGIGVGPAGLWRRWKAEEKGLEEVVLDGVRRDGDGRGGACCCCCWKGWDDDGCEARWKDLCRRTR
jgi:hypothetical protein